MYDVGAILGFMILIVIGLIIFRYLCSFAYGLFCYNAFKHSERTINPINSVDIVNIAKNPDDKIIRVTVDNDYIASDVEINEQRTIPIATMV
jgi:hypothetical protein